MVSSYRPFLQARLAGTSVMYIKMNYKQFVAHFRHLNWEQCLSNDYFKEYIIHLNVLGYFKRSVWKVSTRQSWYRNSILVYIYFTNSRINQSTDGMQLDVFKNISSTAFYSLYQKRACWEEDRVGSGWPARLNLSKCQTDQTNTNLVAHFTGNNSKRISFLWDRDFLLPAATHRQ